MNLSSDGVELDEMVDAIILQTNVPEAGMYRIKVLKGVTAGKYDIAGVEMNVEHTEIRRKVYEDDQLVHVVLTDNGKILTKKQEAVVIKHDGNDQYTIRFLESKYAKKNNLVGLIVSEVPYYE